MQERCRENLVLLTSTHKSELETVNATAAMTIALQPQIRPNILRRAPSNRDDFPMEHQDVPALRSLLQSGKLEPYVRHIRFPRFKNFAPETRLDFSFPITAIVGPNGTNKSSIIKALFGSPGYHNLGNYWFSTSIDPIEEVGDELGRNCFIHGYLNPAYGKIVEVLKTRIQKEGDPDYWEPSRPVAKYDMESMKEVPEKIAGRSKTRWDTINKNALLIDFRQTLSAFDRFFYHTDFGDDSNRRAKKDLVRRRAPHLKEVLEEGRVSYSHYGVERVVGGENVCLDQHQIDAVSRILGRKYLEIRLVKHRLFGASGYTAQLRYGDIQYTEAFAGSGEFATVVLVLKITKAQDSSLILLDEPEVSLFPGAQHRLLDFLFASAKKHRHQVIMATHSASMIRGLPEDAIKVIGVDPGTGQVRVVSQRALPEEAFVAIGEDISHHPTVYVEDRLAVEIVKRALRLFHPKLLSIVCIESISGGAETIMGHYAPVFARTQRQDILIILDGDKRPQSEWPDPDSIPKTEDALLPDKIKSLAGTKVTFPTDGGSDTAGKITQASDAQRKFIGWCRHYVRYLPGKDPEGFLLEKLGISYSGNSKSSFQIEAKRRLQMAQSEELTSQDIFEAQKHCLLEFSETDQDLKGVADAIRQFVSKPK
jgi:predicted ATPase